MLELNKGGDWIPLMDYAIKTGISLSTLRRHIKAKKIEFKVENGRYLIFDTAHVQQDETARIMDTRQNGSPVHVSASEVETLKRRLREAQEEIAELKMLVALYEERIPSQRFSS